MRLRVSQSEARRLAERLRPSARVMARLADTLKSQMEARVASAGQSGGVQWPPRKKDGAPALQGIEKHWQFGHDERSAFVLLDKVAAWHQTGTRTAPPRPQLPLSPEEKREQIRVVAEGIRRGE